MSLGPPRPAVPGPLTHLSPALSLSCVCRQGSGNCLLRTPGTICSGTRLPPAATALFLQLLAGQGMRLLLPPGHHLGEHSRVSLFGDAGKAAQSKGSGLDLGRGL